MLVRNMKISSIISNRKIGNRMKWKLYLRTTNCSCHKFKPRLEIEMENGSYKRIQKKLCDNKDIVVRTL